MENPSDASGRSTATGDHINMVEASENTQQQTTASVESQYVPATKQEAVKKKENRLKAGLQFGSILNL